MTEERGCYLAIVDEGASAPWVCRNCGQVIGWVVRVGCVDTLVLATAGMPAAWIDGHANVACPACHRRRRWVGGRAVDAVTGEGME